MTTSIWWIRRDLRLKDNQALNAAISNADKVIPLFIIDPRLWQGRWYSQRRTAFLVKNLAHLATDLEKRGSQLIVRYGSPLEQLVLLTREIKIESIYAEEDHTPFARTRDSKIGGSLPLKLIGGTNLLHPRLLLKSDGTPYKVYTPFMKRWKDLVLPSLVDPLPAPDRIQTPNDLVSHPLPENEDQSDSPEFPIGEQAALNLLSDFVNLQNAQIYSYAAHRNHPNLNATSGLSPYFRFGLLSIRQAVTSAYHAIQAAQDETQYKGAETWLNELIWREFFNYILYHYPQSLRHSFREEYREIAWANDEEDFNAWKAGKTGFPFIDAAMRQLASTGWMHNRSRMVTASFLVKNLLVDWRWGEAWFMENLLDGDPASNNGGWQWVAGTGTDAAPYFRIFNPITQSQKFDPQGEYIRRFVPELRSVPDQFIHTPWEMSRSEQESAKCILGKDYPEPIIDLKFSRERTLEAYRNARED